MSDENTLTPVRFNYYSLKHIPYKDKTGQFSSTITANAIKFLTREILENKKGYLIDRHANREVSESRELFLVNGSFIAQEQRILCTIAMIRGGRKPMIKPKDEFQLIPIPKELGSVAEQTNFYIDYSGKTAILCVEYNHHGPRAADIEFYLRRIVKDELKVAKATELTLFMDDSLDNTIANLKEVLNLEVKMRPQKITQLDKDLTGDYLLAVSNLGNKVKPQFIRIEALFQTPGKTFDSEEINVEAKNMALDFLRRFKSAPYNKDCFEKFEVKYIDHDGVEEVFALLKGKKEIILEVEESQMTRRKYYTLIKENFDGFIEELRA